MTVLNVEVIKTPEITEIAERLRRGEKVIVKGTPNSIRQLSTSLTVHLLSILTINDRGDGTVEIYMP